MEIISYHIILAVKILGCFLLKWAGFGELLGWKSNQIKSLLLSHHHSTSALVSEILMSVLQTVQKKQQQFTYGQTVQKKQQTIYIWTDSAKKTTDNLHMDRQCKKTALEHLQCSRQCKKKQQQQFTYGQYIFTDCTEDNVQNTHTYTQYT